MKSIILIYFLVLLLLEINSYSFPFLIKNEQEIIQLEKTELSDDIIILFTNDVHCGIIDYIGYDGLMLYKKELQNKYKHVITVDTGDHLQGGTIGLISKGKSIIEIMNKIGYDVAIIGNHEFDYGIKQFEEYDKILGCGYICANCCYHKNKTAIYPEYKIIEAGYRKIAFIGVATPQTLSKSFLHTVVDENGEQIYDFLTEDKGMELYNRIQSIVNEVRDKVDYVIILAHLGEEGDSLKEFTSEGLISHISGLDALLDGHTHRVYNRIVKTKDGKDIPLIQAGTKLSNIGVLKIQKDGTITSEIISEIPEPEDKDVKNGAKIIYNRGNKDRWVDEEMNEFLEDIITEHSGELNKVIGYIDFDMLIKDKNSLGVSILKSYSEEVALGDLVTDALRYIGKAEISMINSGSIRNELFKGEITYNDILEVLPFSTDIIVKRVSGQNILDALEFGVKDLPYKTSRFLQVSGINFKVNTNVSSPVIVDENEMFLKIEGERRVYDAKLGNNKLDVNKNYRISFDNYIANGGDGFSMFDEIKEKEYTFNTDNQALISYIQNILKGKIPDKYKKKENRILIVHEFEKGDEENSSLFFKNILKIIIILYTFFID